MGSQTIPAGTVFYATIGEYDAYEVHSLLRAKKDLKLKVLHWKFNRYRARRPEEYIAASEFVKWLVSREVYVEVLPRAELHINEDYEEQSLVYIHGQKQRWE